MPGSWPRPRADDPACFDVTAVLGLAEVLAQSLMRHGNPSRDLAFLPAPVTVIEYVRVFQGQRTRRAEMLVASDDERSAEVFWVDERGIEPNGWLRLGADAALSGGSQEVRRETWLYALFAILNEPRIVARRERSPHAGLQRDLGRALGRPPGPFLRPWTEVVLYVSPPASPDGAAGPAEPRPSGGKALHLCRAHLRLRNARVEFVRPHWRGDAAHGVAQSTYRVVGG